MYSTMLILMNFLRLFQPTYATLSDIIIYSPYGATPAALAAHRLGEWSWRLVQFLRPKSNAYHYASMQVNYKALQKEMEALRKQIENGGGGKKRRVGGKGGKKRYAVISDLSQITSITHET
jgi:RIO-like serine/threonine protein kinase